jgi:hypothetical protein
MLPERQWREAMTQLPIVQRLAPAERARLRELTVLFLDEKTFSAAAGYALTDEVRLLIAIQACLPILHLDPDYYAGWSSIIVYPDEFMPEREHTDEAGVVHMTRHPLMGESWLQGPLLLSAADAVHAGAGDGVNVVIHECAHKLDMLNGNANGFPPLHADMSIEDWTKSWSEAYADFCRQVDAGVNTLLDPYGAESPGEFFAVLSEAFFETPQDLQNSYPAVYAQLVAFYRQNPLSAG